MRKLAVWFFAVGLVLTFAGRSMAADNATINVQAEIVGSCAITSAPGLQDFGLIDVATYITTTLAPSVNFQCTTGTLYTVTLNGSLNPGVGTNVGPRVLTDPISGDTMSYDILAQSVGSALGIGAVDITYDMDITLPAASVTVALTPGVYVDNFLFEINP